MRGGAKLRTATQTPIFSSTSTNAKRQTPNAKREEWVTAASLYRVTEKRSFNQ
jgi:hypothetical protein